MHTTSSADCVDEFAETVTQKDGKYFYKFGNEERPVTVKNITINYRDRQRQHGEEDLRHLFHPARSHRARRRTANGSRWTIMNTPIPALEQSFGRTKAKDFAEYMKVAAFEANSSNDTLYADDKGNIALLLPQFVPLRDNQFDYTKPVDGSNPATAWKGDDAAERNSACGQSRQRLGVQQQRHAAEFGRPEHGRYVEIPQIHGRVG